MIDKKENNSLIKDNIIVFADVGGDIIKAKSLAEKLKVLYTEDKSIAEKTELFLCFDENGLKLVGEKLIVQGDFIRLLPRIKKSNLQRELLVRASKFKGESGQLTAVDATAGLGEDAFLLAAAGFTVKLFEYDPIIFALLSDALERAEQNLELKDIVSRMELTEADSIVELPLLKVPPHLILLDPMFPEKHKSGLVKKKFQLIHHLKAPCDNEKELLNSALKAHPQKIVIKRPLKSPYLADLKPTYSLFGNSIRYDCLVLPQK